MGKMSNKPAVSEDIARFFEAVFVPTHAFHSMLNVLEALSQAWSSRMQQAEDNAVAAAPLRRIVAELGKSEAPIFSIANVGLASICTCT